MKTLKKIAISVIVATVIFILIFKSLQPSVEDKIEYVEVVVTKVELLPGQKISDENLSLYNLPADLAMKYVQDISEVTGKYAKDKIYPGEFIRQENIKKVSNDSIGSDIREVRILTNLAAYGGVGKGDNVDIIYVDKIGTLNEIGKILYEGLEVKNVLNKSGVDLEKIDADKYNKADLEPGFVVFQVSQEMALEIETLQGITTDVVFKLSRWIDRSKPTNNLPGVKTKESIIYGSEVLLDNEEDQEDDKTETIIER